jgi:putative toxin-antitoxin system antitoxin component (TIGR02293 family)
MAERQHTKHAPKRPSKGGEAAIFGAFDDAMKNAVPGGNLATPVAVAVGALILGKMSGGSAAPPPPPGRAAPPPSAVPTNPPAGSVLGGLSDLIGKLTAGGAAPQVNSWVGPGANQPIQPGQLGSALGQSTLNELSQRTGMSQQELLNQLSAVLPQLINQLTPKGRMPTPADLEKYDSAKTPMMRSVSRAAKSTSGVTEAAHKIGAWGADYLDDVSTLLGGRKVLGSMIESDQEAHELLQRGLPRRALTNLIGKLRAIPVIEVSEALGMSVRTLQRHRSTPVEHLDVQQSGRAWKFAEILAKATRVLGSQEEAEQWLRHPAIGLDQQRPVDLLTTPAGVKLVEEYLGRLEYDVYT